MKQFPLVFKHYLKRTFMDRLALIVQLGIPIGLIVFTILTNDFSDLDANTVASIQTNILSGFVFSFLFFGGAYFMAYTYRDLGEAQKWRLGVAPVNKSVYAMGALAGSIVVSIIQSILVVIVGLLLTDAHIGNIGIFIALLLLTTLLSHFFHYCITFFVKEYTLANTIVNIIGFAFALLGGAWIVGLHEALNHPVADFLYDFGTPVSLARRAIDYAQTDMSVAMQAVYILAGATVLFMFLSFVLGKVKKS